MNKTITILFLLSFFNSFGQFLDVPFKQATSVKYAFAEDLKNTQLKKIVVDYNDIVYLLVDKGLFRVYDDKKVSRDVSYKALTERIPVDICTQEETGYLFYLYENQFLTNSYSGTIYSDI